MIGIAVLLAVDGDARDGLLETTRKLIGEQGPDRSPDRVGRAGTDARGGKEDPAPRLERGNGPAPPPGQPLVVHDMESSGAHGVS